MKSKRYFYAGLFVLFLVSIIGFIGCEHDPNNNYDGSKYNYTWVFTNRSKYTIQVDINPEYSINPRSFYLKPGTEKTCGTNTRYDSIVFSYYRTDTKDGKGVTFRDGTFYNQ